MTDPVALRNKIEQQWNKSKAGAPYIKLHKMDVLHLLNYIKRLERELKREEEG